LRVGCNDRFGVTIATSRGALNASWAGCFTKVTLIATRIDDPDHDSVVCLETHILVLNIAQTLRHQSRTGNQ